MNIDLVLGRVWVCRYFSTVDLQRIHGLLNLTLRAWIMDCLRTVSIGKDGQK